MKLMEAVLGTKNKIKVVRFLSQHKDWEFNITELSKDLKVNKGVVSRLVDRLEKDNLIRVKRKGKIKLFGLNKENAFIREVVMPLFEREKTFFSKYLKSFINKIKDKNILSVVVYGSVARKEATLTSDIDVLVIVERKTTSLGEKVNKIKEDFLNKDLLLTVDIMDKKEFRSLFRKKEPLIKSILRNHVVLYGKELGEVMGK